MLETRPWYEMEAGGVISDSSFMARPRSAGGGGEAESDLDDDEGDAAEVEVPVASTPRCLLNMHTIGSLSGSRVSSIPSRMAAASIS